MSDSNWPCRCFECVGDDSCGVCYAPAGEVRDADCSDHPSNRAPCEALSGGIDYPEPRIARGEG